MYLSFGQALDINRRRALKNLLMKHLLTVLFAATTSLSWGQTLPFDFESATSGMTGYDGATFTIVDNPDTSGNSSSKVAKIVKVNVNDLWAGGKITSVLTLHHFNRYF